MTATTYRPLRIVPRPEKVELLDAYSLAKVLSVSVHTIRKWRADGRIPCYKLGRSVRYDINEVITSMKGA